MRGLNNEQLAVMREAGPAGAEWRRRATRREMVVIRQLEARGLFYAEASPAGNIARLTPMGRLLFDALTSQRLVKGMGL